MSNKPSGQDIHTLIQGRTSSLYDFIREHTEDIDNHVEGCAWCRVRIIGWSSHLPKLRARVTVQFPRPANDHERLAQLRQLKRGQCLPCGCEVTDTPWMRGEAQIECYAQLAEILNITPDQAEKIPEDTQLRKLPLQITSLHRLREKFWLPDGLSGSEELRNAEERGEIQQLPKTVDDFITEIMKLHSGISYNECAQHWCP